MGDRATACNRWTDLKNKVVHIICKQWSTANN
jgi:hypothetical protein